MKVMIHVKGKEIAIPCKVYFSKKFQGLGLIFNCDPIRGYLYNEIIVIEFRLLFLAGWLTIGVKKQGQINCVIKHSDLVNAVTRETRNFKRKAL